MEIRKAELLLVRSGFVLFILALLTGFAVPAFLNRRMAVAAHVTTVLSALLLIGLGLTWGLLNHGAGSGQTHADHLSLRHLCQLRDILSRGSLGNESVNASLRRRVQCRALEG